MGIKKLYQRKGNVASTLQISAATNLAKKKKSAVACFNCPWHDIKKSTVMAIRPEQSEGVFKGACYHDEEFYEVCLYLMWSFFVFCFKFGKCSLIQFRGQFDKQTDDEYIKIFHQWHRALKMESCVLTCFWLTSQFVRSWSKRKSEGRRSNSNFFGRCFDFWLVVPVFFLYSIVLARCVLFWHDGSW